MEKKEKQDFWGDFFYMERLVTPSIIKIINMVFIVLIGLGCLISLIMGIATMGFFGIVSFLGYVIGAAIGYIFFRIFLEISLILFRIEQNTRKK